MSDLRSLQRAFWSALTAPRGAESALAEGAQDAWLEGMVQGDARASARGRLDVYANMYFHRLHDNLALDFPRLAAVLGARGFHRLITAYLGAHPSSDPSVRHLGRALPSFLRERRDESAPWLADLAALEWARLDVFDRVDESVLTFEDLRDAASGGFSGLHLRAIAALTQVGVEYDVTTLWRQAEVEVVAPRRAKGLLLVWRQPDDAVHHRLVDPMEAELVAEVVRGIDFSALCAQLSVGRTDEGAAQQALALVAAWTAAGLLVYRGE